MLALIFFIGRVAFAETLKELRDTCRSAAAEVAELKCKNIGGLAAQVKAFGEIPPDGPACNNATKAYDDLSDVFYRCSSAGTSEKGSCFSICRDGISKIKNNEFDNAAAIRKNPASARVIEQQINYLSKRANLCYQISRLAQKVRFDSIKAPSCNSVTEEKPKQYIETEHDRPAAREESSGAKPASPAETPPVNPPDE